MFSWLERLPVTQEARFESRRSRQFFDPNASSPIQVRSKHDAKSNSMRKLEIRTKVPALTSRTKKLRWRACEIVA